MWKKKMKRLNDSQEQRVLYSTTTRGYIELSNGKLGSNSSYIVELSLLQECLTALTDINMSCT